jgi:fructuronate reductase
MVDRITPVTTEDDRALVERSCGYLDADPVATEPFSEWVISGAFPAGRPQWEQAGVTIVEDVVPFEQRKLWFLNASHSHLAYAASIRGFATIDEAIADPECRSEVELLWDEASRHLDLPGDAVADYRQALLARFANPRMRDQLARIAADGSVKLPVRIMPTVRAERAARRIPVGCATTLAAWVLHLRGHGAPVKDPGAAPFLEAANSGGLAEAAPAVLDLLEQGLGSDAAFVDVVIAQAEAIQRR